ncbi:MAG: hypothetical protein KJ818_05235, partial [Candidatus Omnitrophica bacterium]|nr:hypothetical protein [Candidatus Omnitrophota bacterium]
VKKNSGCLVAFLIGIAVMFFGAIIIAISAAIVIPGFVMAKTRANQASAEAMVKNLSSAIEFYHAESKGKYPLAEETLIQYLPDAYKEGKVNGYVIIKELREDGYRIIARPIQCNNTGKKVFIMETGRNFIVRDCQEGGNYD